MWGELRKLHKYSAGEFIFVAGTRSKGALSAGASESKTIFTQFKSGIMYLFRFLGLKIAFFAHTNTKMVNCV